MDAKKLIYKEPENLQIPLNSKELNATKILNGIISFLENSGKDLQARHTKNKLNYAIKNLKDQGRLKQYSKLIHEKYNIPELQIIEEINYVKFMVLFPLLNNLYTKERKKKESIIEIATINNLINQIESGEIDSLEITIKATSKGVSKDVHLKSEYSIKRIFATLKTFPKIEMKQKAKGRPIDPEINALRYCAYKIQEKYSLTVSGKNNLCKFIGAIFIGAGIFEESEYNTVDLQQRVKSFLA